MSHPDTLIGYIVEGRISDLEPGFVARWNDAAIARVPETDDEYPPLIRSMLAVPRADQPKASFRGQRAISIALHQNWFHLAIDKWLPKFETFLKTLHWHYAVLYLDPDMGGRFTLRYDHPADWWKSRNPEAIEPTAEMELRCYERSSYRPLTALGLEGLPSFTNTDRFEPSTPDRERLQCMYEAALAVRRFVQGHTRNDLESDNMLHRALLQALGEFRSQAEWVGEIARLRVPGVPWKDLRYISGIGPLMPSDEQKYPGTRKKQLDELWHYAGRADEMINALDRAFVAWPLPEVTPPPTQPR